MTFLPILHEILSLGLSAAPWLLFGLVAAGLIKALVPDGLLQRWVGGTGVGAVSRAAVIGAPLPLCSCGAIPTALALYRGGAGKGPTTAFLVGTPGIGADSVALTYALLGPAMLAARVFGAIATAIGTGLMVGAAKGERALVAAAPEDADTCCGAEHGSGSGHGGHLRAPVTARLRGGLAYAFTELLDDISLWVFLGLLLAGLIAWAAPPELLASHGSSLLPMLLMTVIGIPMYICAAAATPIAAGMLLAGVSPGTVLVFLLAGPITSFATLAILRREMGTGVLVRYLLGIAVTAIAAGLAADQAIAWAGTDVRAQIGAAQDLLPAWLEWTALAVLAVTAIRPLRQLLAGTAWGVGTGGRSPAQSQETSVRRG